MAGLLAKTINRRAHRQVVVVGAQPVDLLAAAAGLRPLDGLPHVGNSDDFRGRHVGDASALVFGVRTGEKRRCHALRGVCNDLLPLRDAVDFLRESPANFQQLVLPAVDARHAADASHAGLVERVVLDAVAPVHVEALLRCPFQERTL